MTLDDIKKLQQKKYRTELGYFLVEGEHLILELEKAAHSNPLLAQASVYVSDNYAEIKTTFKRVHLNNRQMQKISATKSPQGIIALVPIRAVQKPLTDAQARTIYLHEIQDPGNLGTILRTLAWFGGFNCLLSPNSVDPYNPKVVRASMGAIFHVPIETDVSLSALAKRFSKIACLDITGTALSASSFSQNQCFIFGNEARGVPRELLSELSAQSFSIQGNGVLESLNLATAVNICAYELNR